MKNREDIEVVLLEILTAGILRIRISAENGDIELCRIEANHLHNIPALINKFSLNLLSYYLDVEVKQYMREAEGKISADFKANLSALQDLRKQLS